MKIYPSTDYRYLYLYYGWYFFFLLLQVSSSLLSYILLSFSFLSQENVFFPWLTIYFHRGFLSGTRSIEGSSSFERRRTFEDEQCSIKFHIKHSRFWAIQFLSFTLLEWFCVRSRLVIKFKLIGFRNAVTNR